MSMATVFRMAGLVIQLIVLLRWTFVLPLLSRTFVESTDPVVKTAALVTFQMVHQLGGVLLGEHIGQLFTIAWSVVIAGRLSHLKAMRRWKLGLHTLDPLFTCLAREN